MRAQALTTLTRRLRRMAGDTAGNTMLLFALCLPVMLVAAGSAVDYGRAIDGQTKMATALDAATLAAARELSNGETSRREIAAVAQAIFEATVKANGGDFSVMPTIDVDVNRRAQTVAASATAAVPATLLNVAGFDEIEVTAESVATFNTTTIELAMVLDITGSMGRQGKLSDLKRAASSVINSLLEEDAGTNDRVRISLIPYSGSVNVGDYTETVTNGVSVDCVTERGGRQKHTDANPIRHPVGTDPQAMTRWRGEYNCPESELRPLSNNPEVLLRNISKFEAEGYTAGHVGTAWGYYTLSPRWRRVWPSAADPRSYDDDDNAKIMILMTDGEFNTYYDGIEDEPFKTNETIAKSAAATRALCDNMKADGIIIYAVAFKSPSDAKELLEDCATTIGDHFFTPETGDDLVKDFVQIAAELKTLRLAK